MKTPKRTLVIVPLNPEDWAFDPPHHAGDMLARWKRKNRVAQLKRSLHSYKHGTNLHFYSHEWDAYKRLQDLRKPGKKATPDDWYIYMKELKCIHYHIHQAIEQAERDKAQADRKEMEK